MRVGRIYYPVNVLGYGNRIGIWLSGCDKKCYNCISPELQNGNVGKEISVDEIISIIEHRITVIDGVTISGGEPLKQVGELRTLIEKLILLKIEDILVYSGYTLRQIQNQKSEDMKYILHNTACMILGEYKDDLNNGVGIRGSYNQEIVVNKYYDRYRDVASCIRRQQIVFSEDKAIIIGIPPKEKK